MNKVLLVSNMFPSSGNPTYGVFVKTIGSVLEQENEIDYVVIDKSTANVAYKLFLYTRFYLVMFLRLIFRKYDYIYIHFISHSALPIIVLTWFGLKFKVICHVHGGDVKNLPGRNRYFFKLKQKIVESILNKSVKIIAPSNSYASYISKRYDLSTSIVVYPSGGVDLDVFVNDPNIEKRSHVIGYAGRLEKSKNVDLIIKAMQEFPDIELELVGGGSQLRYLEKLISELSLEESVTIKKPMNRQSLSEWFSSIECLIYPSSSESLGLVPLEAAACGCNLVLSDIPAFKEFHTQGLNFYMMSELSVESLIVALRKYFDTPEGKKVLFSHSNLDFISKHYSTTKTKKVLFDAFE
ncbi:glycosyltransferase family 4 protein [Aeromonas sp. QDB66]|uniref:glycosyltransferase family 4 protein n=1 Tax=Aeromonas sp. QDB66 TaxID=2989824 RepID=UPI0022E8944A|nr:glycosyltransferase family 4 protein [Aeromonas sp. QDB66]